MTTDRGTANSDQNQPCLWPSADQSLSTFPRSTHCFPSGEPARQTAIAAEELSSFTHRKPEFPGGFLLPPRQGKAAAAQAISLVMFARGSTATSALGLVLLVLAVRQFARWRGALALAAPIASRLGPPRRCPGSAAWIPSPRVDPLFASLGVHKTGSTSLHACIVSSDCSPQWSCAGR